MEVQGKVALVTGGAGGIGLEYVKALLKNNAKGVLIADVNSAVCQKEVDFLVQQYGSSKISFLAVDVCQKTQLEKAFQTAVKIFDQLDIVINNAGIIDEVQWEKCCNVNFIATISGTMLAVDKYLPEFRSSDDAVVINISSILGLEPLESVPVYTATKFGVLGFTRAIGGKSRYKENKIRVIGICPGRTETAIKIISNQQIPEPFDSEFNNFFTEAYNQKAGSVAEHAINLIRNAPSGTIWKVLNDECEEVDFPEYVIG